MPPQKTVFLHVGCRKSGTSGLQLGLTRAAGELRAAGLEQPLGARGGIMESLMNALRDTLDSGDDAAARRAVERLSAAIAESPTPRHLITLEALAELPGEATSLVVRGLADFDTQLVVTVRPWVFTIPSEWQQLVKSRFTTDYLTFARALQRPEDAPPGLAEEAARFRRRQDVADVVRRWRAGSSELPVHVILVPSNRNARPDLTELYCQVLGLEPAILPVPDRVVNPSLSHEDAEVLRLVNLALGDRLADLRGNYRYSVRKWIAVGTMMKGSTGSKIRLPRELEPWASSESGRQVRELNDLGCHLLGDVEGFVHPALPDDDFVPASDGQVAQAAAAVIADLAQWHARERRKRFRAARKGRPKTAHQPATAGGPVARARRVLRHRGLRRLGHRSG